MRVSQLDVEGLFSFGHGSDGLALDFNDRLTVVVGPNAAGKTNVGRSLNLLQSVLRSNDAFNEERAREIEGLGDVIRYSRNESTPPGVKSSIRLSVEFTSEAEHQTLLLYIRSLVISAILGRIGGQPPGQALEAIEDWIATNVTIENIKPLFKGSIVVSHSGIIGTMWDVFYEFEDEGAKLTWHIDTPSMNLRNCVTTRRPELDTVLDSLDQRMSLREGKPSSSQSPPDFAFTFSLLTPTTSNPFSVGMAALNYGIPPAPIREFLLDMGLGSSATTYEAGRRSSSLASPLAKLLHRGIWYLGAEDGSLRLPDGSVDRYRSAGEDAGANDDATPASPIASRLFQLKNGSQSHQKRYVEIQELFSRLAAGRRFEVRLEQSGQDKPRVEIEVFKTHDERNLESGTPLRFAGTGVSQALNIAETLGGNPDRLLILDEPAANLHPTWQRIVLSSLCARTDQSLLITHSPFLVPTETKEQLASLVRFAEVDGNTCLYRLEVEDLEDSALVGALVRDLSFSGDARGLLFASAVILLEGETELGAMPIWCSKSACSKMRGSPEDLNIAFYSVGGDQSFRTYLTYLNRFGIPWAILCDGAAFRLDTSSHIFEQILKSGFDSASLKAFVDEKITPLSQADMNEVLFREMLEIGPDGKVFTLAAGWHREKDESGDDESFESFVENNEALKPIGEAAVKEFPRSKPRAGRMIAELTDCPTDVDDIYAQILGVLNQKIEGLLSV